MNEVEAQAVLDDGHSSPAQRTTARIILGMSFDEATKLEDVEESENLKAWDALETANTVSDLLTSGVLLVNIAMSGGYPQPVREEALRRFRANVEDLHQLKHGILSCKVKAVDESG